MMRLSWHCVSDADDVNVQWPVTSWTNAIEDTESVGLSKN